MRRFILALGLLCSACTDAPPNIETKSVTQADGKTVMITNIACGNPGIFQSHYRGRLIIHMPEGAFMLECPYGRLSRFPEDLNKKDGQ